jgi:site-specific recombinase XerD
MLMLLSRLGLRACEVKNINLEDLHWREGTLTVRGKGKESKMPLPNEVGEAIAIYVKEFRPKTPARSLFVSVFPPHQGFRRSISVSGIVGFALERAKIDSAYKGAYLLRHTVANECLKNGATLSEIGHLLRQNHCATTSIYAKVDFARLSLVARPWIGGAK